MSVSSLRSAGRETLRRAEQSPLLVTLYYLLILYGVLICYNVFSIWYTYRTEAAAGGISAMTRVGRYYAWTMLGPILASLFSGVMDGAYTNYTVCLTKNPSTGFSAILNALSQLGRVLGLTALISLFTALWTMLFVIPGFIAIYRYRLAYQVLFDHPEYSAFQALEESKRLTFGHKMELFLLDLSFFYYYIPFFACSVLINANYFFNLPNPTVRTDLLFYFSGTALAIILQTLLLPHLRASHTAAYFAICTGETMELEL